MGRGEAGGTQCNDSNRRVDEIARLNGFCGGPGFPREAELFGCNQGHGVMRVTESGGYEIFATEAEGVKLAEPNFFVFGSSGNLFVTDSGG